MVISFLDMHLHSYQIQLKSAEYATRRTYAECFSHRIFYNDEAFLGLVNMSTHDYLEYKWFQLDGAINHICPVLALLHPSNYGRGIARYVKTFSIVEGILVCFSLTLYGHIL